LGKRPHKSATLIDAMLFFKSQSGDKSIQLMTDFFACYVSKADRCLTPTTFAYSALQAIAAIRLRQMEVTHIATKTLISFGCVFHRAVCHFVDDVDFLLQHCFANTHDISPLCVADVGVVALRGDCIDHGFFVIKSSSIVLGISKTCKFLTSACGKIATHSGKHSSIVKAHLFVSGHFLVPFCCCKNVYKKHQQKSKDKNHD